MGCQLDLLVAAMIPLSVVVLSCLALVAATDVLQCPGGRKVDTLKSDVLLTPCKKPPCKLKKNTREQVSFKFTTDKEVKELKNHVQAEVFGVPLPFIGVDGASICDKLETETGEKASCPLAAHTTYVYKDSFPIESFYPTVSVKVHWALQSQGKDVACFEVPAKIVADRIRSGKKCTHINELDCGRKVDTLKSDVLLTPCKKPPCKLKKNTREQVSFKFTTDKEVKELKNHVQAEVFGVPLPFIGVDGASICDKLETETGEKASCPLAAHTTYVYKDSFPIESFYPTVSVKLHWALQSQGKDVACFEVPAKIVA